MFWLKISYRWYEKLVGVNIFKEGIPLKRAMLPIGVATYNLTNTLPAEYQDLLPSTELIVQNLLTFLREI
jgi:hypothetical protein